MQGIEPLLALLVSLTLSSVYVAVRRMSLGLPLVFACGAVTSGFAWSFRHVVDVKGVALYTAVALALLGAALVFRARRRNVGKG